MADPYLPPQPGSYDPVRAARDASTVEARRPIPSAAPPNGGFGAGLLVVVAFAVLAVLAAVFYRPAAPESQTITPAADVAPEVVPGDPASVDLGPVDPAAVDPKAATTGNVPAAPETAAPAEPAAEVPAEPATPPANP